MTRDHKRDGTATLSAAPDGTVPGRRMRRHRHQGFVRSLDAVGAAVPAGKLVHAIMDDHAARKHPKVRAWLARHPRRTFRSAPTSASWPSAVEGFSAKPTERRLKRGVSGSIAELQGAIDRSLAGASDDPRPLVRTADPDRILGKVSRGHQR